MSVRVTPRGSAERWTMNDPAADVYKGDLRFKISLLVFKFQICSLVIGYLK